MLKFDNFVKEQIPDTQAPHVIIIFLYLQDR
jgi:hypothetical protein